MAPLVGPGGTRRWHRSGTVSARCSSATASTSTTSRVCAQYKEKFDPVWEPRYLASPGGWVLPAVMADLATLVAGGVRGLFFK